MRPPSQTLRATAAYCQHNSIHFPPVDEAKLQEWAQDPHSCYILQGDKGPVVMHIPLFNLDNCGSECVAGAGSWLRARCPPRRAWAGSSLCVWPPPSGTFLSNLNLPPFPRRVSHSHTQVQGTVAWKTQQPWGEGLGRPQRPGHAASRTRL